MASETDNQPPRQVLFVDDEPDFLRLMQENFAALSAGRWEIHCACAPDSALEQLKQCKMDLVVVDTHMPLLDGAQFLALMSRRYPDLKKVSLSAEMAADKRAACLAAGAELYIEKPSSEEGFKSVFAMLDDLMDWKPAQGFQGMLRRVGLQDVIQMECIGRNSSVLEIHNEHLLGRIYIHDGSIIHAAGGELTGERALQKLLALAGGSFELMPFEPPPQNTISGPWEFLLMEAARVRDELAAQAAPAEPVDESPLPAAPVPPPPPAASAMVPAPPAAAPATGPVRITETLICSGEGKTLYEADCSNVPSRVLLLKNIAQLAAQLAQAAALGNFDRLELQLTDGRVIAQARPDRLVFVAATRDHASP